MDWSILFLGPVGAGKTEAIRTMSDIEVVSTEAGATDETALLKANTTVAMDMGVMHLEGQDKVVLYGAPGQDRFDFMWEILLEQARGLVLLVDHSRQDPVADLAHYTTQLRRLGEGAPPRPMVIGVTHADLAPQVPLDGYRRYLRDHAADLGGETLPVCRADARNRREVNNLLLALTSMMDFAERFPRRAMA